MTEILFWLSLALIVYTYIGYPLLCVLLGRVFGRKPAPCGVPKEFRPTVSVIIACHNEEKVIRAKIENTLALDYPRDKLQVIVASESTDATDSIARQYAPRVELISAGKRCGKTGLLWLAVPRARGEILLFSDANVSLDTKALALLVDHFCDERVGAVSGSVCVTNPLASSVSRGEHIYKRYESLLRSSNSALGRVLNPDGALFALRASLYRPLSQERGDDFELVVRVLIAGKESLFEPRALAYEDASVEAHAEIERKIRMVSWFLRSSIILAGEMIKKGRFDLLAQLVSHKLMRWSTPYFFALALVTNGILAGSSAFYAVLLIVQIIWYAAGCLGWSIARYFLVYNYGFLAGTLKGLFSTNRCPAWEKTRI